ncbi:virulence factor [Granulicatella balaenopterae]|uniref:Virulence factor n=1 Tax=Granulicatella balaenopterae TaxID=137733 RepID=A0A1H9L3I0_9LACT|nr:Gfo/Idh/MocA family oxidoreductase [Granulicatella balaenopterae]SER06061.1 virulence factor [Granulicatella balaenopterae]
MMLNIGVIGLGNIARKAYLPIMRTIKNVKWYAYSRNKEILKEETSLFGSATPCNSLEEMLQLPLDGVFIHVATPAHYTLVSAFLNKGIPVYVDKPVVDNFEDTLELYTLANEKETVLMAGFNRRFTPKVQELKQVPQKNKIVVEKNYIDQGGQLRDVIFDTFIHPIDTALYLLDGKPQKGSFYYKKRGKKIEQCEVYIETKHQTAVVGINLASGANREIIEVQSTGGTYHLENLTDLTIYQGDDIIKEGFDEWATPLYKRGFETIVKEFVTAIETKENPVSASSSLLTHLICDRISTAKAPEGFINFTLPKAFRK